METLKHATLATVSRCGMVWFSADIVKTEMIYHHYLCRLVQDNYDDLILDDNYNEIESNKVR